MSNFNFSLDNTQIQSTATPRFKPYTINEFTSVSAEVKSGANWKALEITFTGEKGMHKEMLFYPKDEKDTERRTYPGSNGHEMVFPSNWESFKQTIAHILGMYSPEGFEKFKAYVAKIKSLDQFVEGFVTLIGKAPEHKLYLKVVGRNSKGSIYAALPNSCSISSKGELYPVNFIGEEENSLQFTSGEMKKKTEYESAKPTPMGDSSTDLGIDTTSAESEDIDFDALEAL